MTKHYAYVLCFIKRPNPYLTFIQTRAHVLPLSAVPPFSSLSLSVIGQIVHCTHVVLTSNDILNINLVHIVLVYEFPWREFWFWNHVVVNLLTDKWQKWLFELYGTIGLTYQELKYILLWWERWYRMFYKKAQSLFRLERFSTDESMFIIPPF